MRVLAPLMLVLFCLAAPTPATGQDSLQRLLPGVWVADAFGGQLHERWELGPDGSVVKSEGYFVMDGDTTYSETVVVAELAGSTYLIAHPSTGGVLVWAATEMGEGSAAFENSRNSDPRRIEYLFGGESTFTRTLYRRENGEEVVTELFFRRRR